MTLSITLDGADQLASSARRVADQLGSFDHAAAAEEVIGYITHPSGTPAGIARALRVEPTEDGFALTAGSTNEPFLTRFLTDPFDTRAQAVAETYRQQLEQQLATITGV